MPLRLLPTLALPLLAAFTAGALLFSTPPSQAAGYSDNIPSTVQTYADVPNSQPLWLYSARLTLHGVISGYSGDGVTLNPCLGTVEQLGLLYYRPCNAITRAQPAKIVANTFYSNCQTHQ